MKTLKPVKENTNRRFLWHWYQSGSIHTSTPHGRSQGRKKEKITKVIVGEERDKVKVRKEK